MAGPLLSQGSESTARVSKDQRDQEQRDRYEKNDLGEPNRGSGDSTESQQRCNQGDDEKRDDPTQHGETSEPS